MMRRGVRAVRRTPALHSKSVSEHPDAAPDIDITPIHEAFKRYRGRVDMEWTRVFLNVTTGALAGMMMGGLFGFASGSIAPTFFRHIIPWIDVEPRGVATILGAAAGVLLGGGLATFAVIVQAFVKTRGRRP